MKSILFGTCARVRDADTPSGRLVTPVLPVHTSIPGRARFKVTPLYRSPTVKHRLESELRGVEGILAADGNELTGSLLVEFDRRRSVEDVVRIIADTLETPAAPVKVHGELAAPLCCLNHLPIPPKPAFFGSQALHSNVLPVALVSSSPLVLLPILFLRMFFVGLFRASPIILLFTASIVILGQVVGKKEGWSRSEALYFAFATASTLHSARERRGFHIFPAA